MALEVNIARPMVTGIGIDVVDIERFRRSLERTPSLRTRVFTAVELDDAASRPDPVPSLAARFAAREAAMKALGVGLGAFGFHDVWVERLPSGAPRLVVAGTAARLADEAGVVGWHVSLSHSATVAVAYVLAQ